MIAERDEKEIVAAEISLETKGENVGSSNIDAEQRREL